ncbi:DNA-directed RNA polymerase I subunit [Saccharomycopsis crataegensis]|uniref:DNA-directed RNA polymerase I subunit n=1 Tax=Saccharomycopsis crataegensis TaxID=43959 RepID=A0AAV5QTL0_9ASCO|nr:DNA-directed RNA polymerase I subunit [Saccharomycopsis crataegensis]
MGEKRKSSQSSTELRVSSYSQDPSLAVASFFNGFSASNDSKFNLYKHKHNNNYLLHGENQTLAYDGKTDADDDFNKYYIAVYDSVNKSVDIYNSPVIDSKVVSKKKMMYRGPKVRSKDALNVTKRNALGQEFGTKKAKKSINSLSQNRIEADKLAHDESSIVENIKQSTELLPTINEMNDAVTNDRPTPACNVDATNVEDIYSINSIIPKKEWNMIRIDSLLKEADTKKKLEFFPYAKSEYIKSRVGSTKSSSKLKLLYYASLLIGVYETRKSCHNKLAMLEKLNSPPEVLVDGILDRFTTLKSSGFGKSKERGFTIDPYHEDKLLCYLLATVMHIDNFLVLVPPLAQELSMKPSRLVGLFRALGATVKGATVSQAEAFNIPRAAASNHKVATLKVPFKEPQMVRRGRRA